MEVKKGIPVELAFNQGLKYSDNFSLPVYKSPVKTDPYLKAMFLICVGIVFIRISTSSEIISYTLGNILMVSLVVGMAVYSVAWLLFSKKRVEMENSEAKEEQRYVYKNHVAKQIYQRLRYVENDFIVYDPLTGRQCSANKDDIHDLISSIADNEIENADRD